MNATETLRSMSSEKKTALCIGMSLFYCAMLAYPFGVAAEGYVWQKAVVAGAVLFAISIPAWIVNLKREFYGAAQGQEALENELDQNVTVTGRIGELARMQRWLSVEDVAQILFCQDAEAGSKFGQIAVKRNYLTPEQLDTLLGMQRGGV